MKNVIILLLLTTALWAESPFRSEVIVTSEWGATTGYGGERRNNVHEGVDLIPVDGDWIIFPIRPGIVTECRIDPIYGKMVVVDHGENLYSLYAHGSIIYNRANVGMEVTCESAIMKMGTTGYSDGPHLHLGVFKIEDGERVFLPPGEYRK